MNKTHYWIVGILVILVATNPTMQDFKDYKGSKAIKRDFYNLSKKGDFFVFSIYDDGFTRTYFGILNNFIPIGNSSN